MKKILVINPFGIGDVIFTMTAVEALRSAVPQARVDFLCNERTRDLARLNASIDQTFVFSRDEFRGDLARGPFVFLRKLGGFLSLLRRQGYDTAFDFSLGREVGFFAWLIGIPKRIGFDFKGRGNFLTHRKKIEGYEGKHAVEWQLSLLESFGIPCRRVSARLPLRISAEARRAAEAFLGDRGILEGDTVLAVAPGGGKSWGKDAVYKQWGADRFAEAIGETLKRRPAKAVLLGAAEEKALLSEVASRLGVSAPVAAGAPLETVCAILLRSTALFCNDGGLLHLANALGVKTVSVFGPVDPRVYGPYGNQAPHEALVEDVPCRPCYRRFHFPPCRYERRCLDRLRPEKAVAALEKMI
ncbi:MAG: glycosyltransferase family 9 protein [Candidatus Omnitrophica bacterium]|nr:glycosyltransferase family 9 protein [Candidatus Omnitrophota bacterium]